MAFWQPASEAPEGVVVDTMIDDGDGPPRNFAPLKRKGRLWFMPDDSMYVREGRVK